MTSGPPGRTGFRREEKEIIDQGAPVDFSFKRARFLSELEKIRPSGFRVQHMPIRGSDLKYLTRSVWLNNNHLTNINGFSKFLGSVLAQPSALGWIDLAFNNITDISDEFLSCPNLRILYLHGNCIQNLTSIEKLHNLERLISITFHGNPIESIPSYRGHIINMLPQIRNLDFAPVVPAERESVPPGVISKKQARSKL